MSSIHIESLVIPTYRLDPARAHADFTLWKGRIRTYPYPRLDRWASTPTPVTYQAVILENEYLTATILPELGGHVYSVIDRLTGGDLFFRNRTIKPALVAPRGAWIAGGIEFNFPVGHSLVTVSPVDWATESTAVSAAVTVGHTDRVTGMRISVTLSLRPGIRTLEQTVVMRNEGDLPQPFFYWCNAAVEAYEDTRFVYPMNRILCDEFDPGELTWPIHDGVDLSLFRNNRRPSSHFALAQWGGFFGTYRPSTDSGTFHWALPDALPGRKAWTWGTAGDGQIWYDMLDDSSRPYVEIQSGLMQNQKQFAAMPAGGVLTTTEYWLPVSGIGQPDWVDGGGALRVDDREGVIHYAPAVRAQAARVEISATDGRSLFSCDAPLDPASPLTLTPGTDFVNAAAIRVIGPDGQIITQAELHKKPVPEEILVKSCSSNHAGADTHCRIAFEWENSNRWQDSAAAYRTALMIDPSSSAAAIGLARLALRRGEWQQATEHAAAACALTGTAGHDAAEAHLLLGIGLRHIGDAVGARAPLRIALAHPMTATTARRHLVELALAHNDLTTARALALEGPDPALRVLVCQRQGQHCEAMNQADLALRSDPLHPLLRSVAGVAPDRVGDRAQLRRNLAALDARSGDWEMVLQRTAGDDLNDVMLLCWRAEALRRTGRTAEAVASLATAATKPLDGTFLWDLNEVSMVESLWQAMPHMGFLAALLGTYYIAVERFNDAAATSEAAQSLLPTGSRSAALVARNRAVAYKALGHLVAAATASELAIQAAPSDAYLYAEADVHLEAIGNVDRRRHLIESGLQQGLTATPFLLRALRFFVMQQQPERAVAVIEHNQFTLQEGQLGPRVYYVAAYLLSGWQRLSSGDTVGAISAFRQARVYPRTFGIGEPNQPDHTQAWFLEGLAHARHGNAEAAHHCWEAAAQIPAREESCYYQIEALRQLGRHGDADSVLDSWQRTSLPDGPTSRVLFLKAIQALAAGRQDEGRSLLMRADEAEATTGADFADLLRSAEALVPERRRPHVIRNLLI
jgi:tetratricopeptide (TPR) repeat protein